MKIIGRKSSAPNFRRNFDNSSSKHDENESEMQSSHFEAERLNLAQLSLALHTIVELRYLPSVKDFSSKISHSVAQSAS